MNKRELDESNDLFGDISEINKSKSSVNIFEEQPFANHIHLGEKLGRNYGEWPDGIVRCLRCE